jgi:hypothetical protein
MSSTIVPLANKFLTGSILSLVLPVAVVIVVTIWYVTFWRRSRDERRAGDPADATSARPAPPVEQ